MGTPAPHGPAAAPAAIGPVDRVTFFEEQRRNRRRSWRFSALGLLAVLATGIPVSIIITPYLYAFLLLTGHIANAIRPLDPATMGHLHAVAYLLPRAIAQIGKVKSVAAVPALLLPLVILVLPGAALMLLLWIAVRLVFRSTGVGGILLRLNARPPRAGDLDEERLVHLVEEMSIAAGVPVPRVLVIDSPNANVAAIGSSLTDGAIVVTRGLLTALSREQAEAMIAHVVGSVGNGDLSIARVLLSVYRTFGIIEIVLDSALGPPARDAVWRLVRLAFMTRGTDREEREAGEVSELLEAGAAGETPAASPSTRPRRGAPRRDSLLWSLFFGLPAATAQFSVGMASALLFGPAFAALWRTRRRLADASAVQLTRNPESLASALERLQQVDVHVAGGEPVSYLFAIWRGAGGNDRYSSFQPSVSRRLKRLQAMGAKLRAGERLSRGAVVALVILLTIIGPLMIVALGLSIVALAMMLMLTVAIMSVMLVVADKALGAVFRWGPVLIHTWLPHWIARLRAR